MRIKSENTFYPHFIAYDTFNFIKRERFCHYKGSARSLLVRVADRSSGLPRHLTDERQVFADTTFTKANARQNRRAFALSRWVKMCKTYK